MYLKRSQKDVVRAMSTHKADIAGGGQGQKILSGAIVVVGIAMVVYHLVCTQYLLTGPNDHQSVHLCFSLLLIFLVTMRATTRRILRLSMLALLLSSIVTIAYIIIFEKRLMIHYPFLEPLDIIIGIILVVTVIEATRQAWGPVLPIVVTIFILYAAFGHFLPEPFWHYSVPLHSLISWMSMGFEGVFGIILGASANLLFLFLVFGTLLMATGATQFFMEAGKAAGRVLAGGPGQTAIVSSSLVGMVTGSAMGNVTITGAFTIPAMKKTGYTPETAGAIEATASTGGQLMPPIMGAAAFLMAAITGTPYARIMLAGIIPALLYYLVAAVGVQVLALKQKIGRSTEKVSINLIVSKGPSFIIPLGLIIFLILDGRSPMYAAFWAILTLLALSLIRKKGRPSWRELAQGFVDGAITGAKIAVACACVGMMVKVMTATGFGVKAAGLIVDLSGGHLLVALILTMTISIILGIGVPTVAAYLLVAMIIAPVLINMGVGLLQAHFFCFYFAIIAALTPPVAMAVVAASSIAKGNYFKTGLEAIRLGLGGFILPYLIVFVPVMLLDPMEPVAAILSLMSIVAGLIVTVSLLYGYFLIPMSLSERILTALAAGALLAYPFSEVYLFLVVGTVLFVSLAVWQWRRKQLMGKSNSTEV